VIVKMGRQISEINIKSYRGITDFKLNDLADINIIVGENNCGKTSLFEAIQILNRPYDFGNIVMISRQRDKFRILSSRFMPSQYSSFLNIFNKFKGELNFAMDCETYDGKIDLSLTGEIHEALMGEDQLAEMNRFRANNGTTPAINEEIMTFFGRLTVICNETFINESSVDVMLNKYSRIMRSSNSRELYSLSYMSPIDHAIMDRFNEITRTKNLREDVIRILQSSFDPDIQDLRTIEEDDGRIVRMVSHKRLGDMPLSTYGDGIKKVISLANAAASIKNGIMLVDEYETAIHPKAMDQVFMFLINICKERNIQLFLNTHSNEALEKMLQCNNVSSDFRVITMYKNADRTTARILDKEKAFYVKDELGLELRQ